jgi:hypothetical protein
MMFGVAFAVHAQDGASGSRFTVGGEYRLKVEGRCSISAAPSTIGAMMRRSS